jgi:hypothetical protein
MIFCPEKIASETRNQTEFHQNNSKKGKHPNWWADFIFAAVGYFHVANDDDASTCNGDLKNLKK